MMMSSLYSPRVVKRILASGAIGNILETYDLILLSLMATTLGNVFFPPSSNSCTLIINILCLFFVSLLMRPIGNIIMALFADQLGRKRLMFFSLTSTGICSIMIGFLPGYQSIGIVSTIMFIFFRIAMNFFVGIEYVNSVTYLLENSDKQSRGFFGSWGAIGISGGYLAASIVAFSVSYLLTKHIIPDWGWRFVFLFSIIGVPFGIWIRYSIPESLEFMVNNASTIPIKKSLIFKKSILFIITHPKQCLAISALALVGTCLSYIYYIYIPLTLMSSRHFSHEAVLVLNISALSLVVILIPIFGKLSDYYGRALLFKIICMFVALLSLPFFWASAYSSYVTILLVSILISIPSACFFSIYPTFLIENFPSRIRCTAASLIHQIVCSLGLGILSLTMEYFNSVSNRPYLPAYILIVSSLFAYVGLNYLSNKASSTINIEEMKAEVNN